MNSQGLVIVEKVSYATIELLEAVFSEQYVMNCNQYELMDSRRITLTVAEAKGQFGNPEGRQLHRWKPIPEQWRKL
jgi:hypothetical protein